MNNTQDTTFQYLAIRDVYPIVPTTSISILKTDVGIYYIQLDGLIAWLLKQKTLADPSQVTGIGQVINQLQDALPIH